MRRELPGAALVALGSFSLTVLRGVCCPCAELSTVCGQSDSGLTSQLCFDASAVPNQLRRCWVINGFTTQGDMLIGGFVAYLCY